MVYLYILQSLKDNGYYVGISSNLGKRLQKHDKGGVRSTKTRRPFKLIYSEKFEDYIRARSREKEVKSYKGGNKFRELIK